MITLVASPIRNFAGAVAASFIVGIGLLALDQGYVAAAPPGVIEIGKLQLVQLAQPGESVIAAAASLPAC